MGGWGHVSSVKWTIHSLQWLSSIQQASPSPPYLCVVVYKVSTQFLQPQLISSDISRLSRARLPPADGISPTLHTLATGGCSKYGEYDNYIQQAPPVGTTKRNVDGHDSVMISPGCFWWGAGQINSSVYCLHIVPGTKHCCSVVTVLTAVYDHRLVHSAVNQPRKLHKNCVMRVFWKCQNMS